MPEPTTFRDDPHDVAAAVANRLGNRRLGLFLDFDGTLAPIVPGPEQARLPTAARAALVRLAEQSLVAIVSGRDLDDVSARVDVPGLIMAGAHGYAIRGGGVPPAPVDTAETADRMAAAAAALERRLAGIAGVRLEPKEFAVAAHWRHVDPSAVPDVEAALDAVAAEQGGLRKTHGLCVFELRPAEPWDKGRGILWILDHQPQPLFPVFLGDDVTDLDGLAAVRERGVGIVVGEILSSDAGEFHLAGPPEVAAFLAELDAQLRR